MSKQESLDKLLKPNKRRERVLYQSDLVDGSNTVVSTKKERVSKSVLYDEFSRVFKAAFLLYMNTFDSLTEMKVFLATCLLSDPETNRYCYAGGNDIDDVDLFCNVCRDSRRKIVSRLIKKGFLRRVQNSIVEVNPNFSHRGEEQDRKDMVAYKWPGGGDHTKGMNKEYAIQDGDLGAIMPIESDSKKNKSKNNKKNAIRPNHEF